MSIRRMKKEDVLQVAQIEAQVFSRPWSRQGFMDALNNPAALFLVEEQEVADTTGAVSRMIAGYIGMYIALDEGEITNVAVFEPLRKQGTGSRLVQAMIQEARQRAVTRIVLEVRCSNEPAIQLYEKYGFLKVGVRKGFYEAPREDANIMVWEDAVG